MGLDSEQGCLSLSISAEMQGWEAEPGTLFAHSWLRILTGFHLGQAKMGDLKLAWDFLQQ